jgi:FkbM family methyltransferase
MKRKLAHAVKRAAEFFLSSEYRRIIAARLVCAIIRKLNSDIRYLGIDGPAGVAFLHIADSVVTPYTLRDGSYQKGDVDQIVALLKNAGRLTHGIFVDAGANIGTTSLYGAFHREFSHVYGFEPVPANFRLAKANVAANDLEAKITLVPHALGQTPGTLVMDLAHDNHGDHRMQVAGSPLPGRGQATVAVSTLDGYFSQVAPGLKIALLWIDTQGFEGFVVKGAEALIQEQGFPICLEFWPYGLRQQGGLDLLLGLLKKYYQGFYDLRQIDRGFQPISRVSDFAARFTSQDAHTDLLVL